MLIALTRLVSPRIGDCELTHRSRTSIDFKKAQLQHRLYEECLTRLGCTIRQIVAAPECPDSVFVEDTCIVFDELAIITRPGAVSRRMETAGVADVLREYRSLQFLEPPATLDGGDVLQLGRRVFVGTSSRTTQAAIAQLRSFVAPAGYEVIAIPLTHGLHLKSAVTQVGENTLLVNRHWVDPSYFAGWNFLEVDHEEPDAANALLIGETVVFPTAYPRTLRGLELHGICMAPVNVSELLKAEAGVTCCSLVFEDLPVDDQ